MSDRWFEIWFTGEASAALADSFDDVQLTVDRGVTRLRTPPIDQTSLWGLLARLDALGLDVLGVHGLDAVAKRSGTRLGSPVDPPHPDHG